MPMYIPTKAVLSVMVDEDISWPDLVRELDNVESITPIEGYETRLRYCGTTLQAYVEPGQDGDAPVLFIVGLRTRERAQEPSRHRVVGVETPAQRSTRRGGAGRRWPSDWPEVLDRLERQPDVRVVRGGKHLVVVRSGRRVCTLPVSASDYRSIRNACSQLQRLGIDVSR